MISYIQTTSLNHAFYWVPANVTLAVHYDRFRDRDRGSIPYEREDRSLRTPNVTVYDVWQNIGNMFKDDGWTVGQTIIFDHSDHLYYRKAVALHVETCNGECSF